MATVQEDDEWVKYRQMFADVYDQSNYSSPLQSRVMRASHQVLEKRFDATRRFARVIEVGAGTGEHLGFVRHTYDEYITTDLDPAALRVAEKKSQTHARGALSFDVQPAEKLAYPDSCADRLIAVHVLEHIYYPHLALKEWRRVLKDGGVLSVLIPTDPGLAWRLGRYLGPRKAAVAQGLPYDYIIAREHVNACTNLIALLRHYFPDCQDDWWPLRVGSVDLNLFYAFHATVRKQGP